MPTILRDINLKEISLVDKGASGDDKLAARVALWKRKEPMPEKMSLYDRVKAAVTRSKAEEPKQMTAEDVKSQLMGQLDESGQALLSMLLELVAASGTAAPAAPAPEPEMKQEPAVEEPPKPEDNPEMAKLLDKSPELKKYLDAEREAREKLAKDLDKARKDNEKTAELLKVEADARRFEKHLSLVKDLVFVPGSDHEGIAKMLMEADELSPEAQDTLSKLIGLSNAAVSKSPFLREKGTSRQAESDTADSEVKAQVNKAMADAEKAGKPITYATAYKKVLAANRELRKRLNEERTA